MESVSICVVQLPGTVRGKSKIKFVAAGGRESTERGKHPKLRPAKTPTHTGWRTLKKAISSASWASSFTGAAVTLAWWWRSSGAPARVRKGGFRCGDHATARGRAGTRAWQRGQCMRHAAAPSAAHTDRQQRHGGQHANARVHPHEKPLRTKKSNPLPAE